MSTLDDVRTLLCLPADTSPDEVLKAAQDELDRLGQAITRAKNVQQRNGASKKLNDLKPRMAALEIEVSLSAAEKTVEGGSKLGSAQRASLVVQLQTLGERVEALPAGEQKSVFQQWLSELRQKFKGAGEDKPVAHPVSPTPSPAGPANAGAAGANVKGASPTESERAVVPTPQNSSAPAEVAADPAAQLRDELSAIEQRLRARPVVDPASISRDNEALRKKLNRIQISSVRNDLERRSAIVATNVRSWIEIQSIWDEIGRIEKAVEAKDPDVPDVLKTIQGLGPRVSGVPDSRERTHMAERLEALKVRLGRRQQANDIESALDVLASQLQKNAPVASIKTGLDALQARLPQIEDVTRRGRLAERIDSLRKTMATRLVSDRMAESIASIHRLRTEGKLTKSTLPELERLQLQTAEIADASARERFRGEIATLIEEVGRAQDHEEPPPLPPLEKPTSSEPALQPAVVLRLEPVAGKAPAHARSIVFVARDRFLIGRKPEKEAPRADLLTPSAETRISRVHVSLFRKGRDLLAISGEEGKPSVNPALIDEAPLSSSPIVAALENERRIDLTGAVTIQALRLPSGAPFGPSLGKDDPLAGNGETVRAPVVSGCVRFRASPAERLQNQAVWIFTDATVGTDSKDAVQLANVGRARLQVRIHYWRQCFWIEAIEGEPIGIDGVVAPLRSAQPVRGDQVIKIGDTQYKAQLT